MITLTVNGKTHSVDADPDTPLLWVLRDNLRLTGTKYGCGIGECGACSVIMNGEIVNSCDIDIENSAGGDITTIEGLAKGGRLNAVQQAFIDEGTTQCGWCIPGQIVAASYMLETNPEPTDAEINLAMKDNLCRCGAYERIRKAIHRAARSA
jgi:aerobic-type carbon monoxide dehydrogenase small subunit (CoxS/CutS family)